MFCYFFYDFLSLKTNVNVVSKINKQKNLVAILKIADENSKIRSWSQIRIS